MRNSIIIIAFITIFSSFAGDGKFQEFSECKKEMKELREAHAYEVAFGGDFFLNSEFFSGLSRIPGIIYFGQKAFSFRPWLKEIDIDKKIQVCMEVRDELRHVFGEPIGIESISRMEVEDLDHATSTNFHHESVKVFSR